MYDDEDNNKDDGSVWTSYSDLFTTVAVIFLVMFVFALIKAGVSSMKNVVDKRQHEAELQGKVSKKVKKQTELKITKVNDSLDDINEYENLIDKKMQEMGKFVQNLQKNKKVMKDLIKDQRRKEAQLVIVNEAIVKVEEKLQVTNLKSKNLEKIVDSKHKLIEKLGSKQIELQNNLKIAKNEIISKNQILEKEQLIKDQLSQKVTIAHKSLEKEQLEKKQRDFKISQLQKQLIIDKESSDIELSELSKNLEIKSKIETQLAKSIEEKRIQLAKLDKYTKQLETNLAKNKQNIEKQTFQIANQETMLDEQSKKITQLDDWKANKKLQIASLDEKVNKLKVQNSQQTDLNKQLETTNTKLVQNKQAVTSALLAKTKSLKDTEKSLNETQSEYKTALAKLSNSQQSEKRLKVENDNLSKKSLQFKDLVGSLQKENNNWKSKHSALESQKSLLDQNLNAAQSKNQRLDKTNLELGQKVAKLASEKSHAINENKYFQNELSDKNTDIKTLTASLKNSRNQINDLSGQLSNSEVMNGQLTARNNGLESDSKNNQRQIQGLQQRNIQAQQQLLAAESTARNLANEKGQLENKLANLKSDKSNVGRKIASVEANLDNLKFEKQQNEQKLVACETDKKLEGSRLKELQSKFSQKLGKFDKSTEGLIACHKSKSNLVKHNSDLKDSLNDFATKVANVKGRLRSSIANDLTKAFKNAKLSVMVDKKSGNVVFQMDKNFRFKKNSYYLNKAARRTLKKIIPIYSKVLFGNKKIKNKIAGFNVTGHASPSHKGRYVSPLSSNSTAYSYNMRLSAQRAASVTNYIFGRKIGKYSYKTFLKEYTSSIGQGFTRPIKKKGRKIASSGACGPFDCYSSQRVELSFTLKDDVDSINKLIEMAKDIK
jgi:chromosome segregation ATPase